MTWRRGLFVLVLLAVLVAALLPRGPDLGAGDKANHMAAFAMLAVLAAWAWPRTRLTFIGAALSAFGGVIEGLQALPAIARDADWADWVADTAAIVAVVLVVALVRRSTSSAR